MSNSQNHALLRREDCTSLVQLLGVRAEADPDALLYRFLGDRQDESLSYGQLHEAARAIAAELSSFGQKGDRVLLLFRPGLAYIRAFFGCLYAGRVAVPLYPPRANARARRVEGALFDCGATAALTDPEDQLRIGAYLKGVGLGQLRVLAVSPDERAPSGFEAVAARREDLAFLQYTSGSTGNPKGVMVSHGNLLANQATIAQAFATSERDVCFNWLPLYHDMGLIGNVLHPLYMGFPSILTSPVAFIRDPLAWLEGIDRLGASVAGAPNFAYELLCRKYDAERLTGVRLDHWRVAYNGAEPVRAETLARFAETFAPHGFDARAFYPCYGMAEATLFISGGRIGQATRSIPVGRRELSEGMAVEGEDTLQLTSCGRAFADHEICIVDSVSGEHLPPRRVGEIWFRGPSKCGGYWQKDELNRATFEAVSASGDGPWLRTGDLGFLADGDLFVTGRLKDLIIVRGRNHYPQDIELSAEACSVLLRSGGSAAFCMDVDSEERLMIAAEVTRQGLAGLDAEAVAATVREAVARDHQLSVDTVVFIKPGSLPKTSSGKKRRLATRDAFLAEGLALVAADSVLLTSGTVSAATFDPLLSAVCSVVASCLRRNPNNLLPDQALTAQGMDSIAAIELQQGLLREFGVEFSLATLLAGISLRALRDHIEQGDGKSHTLVSRPWPAGEAIPLSFNQEALFFHHLVAAEQTPHNLAFAARLDAPLERARLEAALRALLLRHPVLGAVFRQEHGDVVQLHGKDPLPELVVIPRDNWSDESLQALLAEQIGRPFDLEHGPIMRVCLLDGDAPVLLLCVHHIAVDFQGLLVLAEDLALLYADQTLAPAGTHGYRDFVAWQRLFLSEAQLEPSWQFWKTRLDGELPLIELPRDFARGGRADYSGANFNFSLPVGVLGKLEALARSRQSTLFSVLLASYLAFLHRYSGQDDVLVGTPVSQRNRPEFAETVGYLANMAVIRDRRERASSFFEAIDDTHQLVLEALAHGDFPFQRLVKQLKPERGAHHPFFQTAFVLQQTHSGQELGPFALGAQGGLARFGEWCLTSLDLPSVGSQFDLTLSLARCGNGLAARIDYATACFRPESIAQFASLYGFFLEQLFQAPDTPCDQLPLLPAEARAEVLAVGAQRGAFPVSDSLFECFKRSARRRAGSISLRYRGESVSYAMLAARAQSLANALHQRGIGPEDRVGLFCEPSPDMIVGILGILGCGAIYVPMDPSYPRERLDFLIGDSAVKLLLTHLEPDALPEGLDALQLFDLETAGVREQVSPRVDPDGAAYMIYTSGSTGKPKGTLVTHRNVIRLFTATETRFAFSEMDTWSLFHSFAFDFSVWEIWGALLYGGSLLIVDKEDTRSPARFAELLVDEGVTVLNQTPSAFFPLITHLCRHPLEQVSLRWIIFGGEALSVRNLAPWFDHFGDAVRLVNMYGITETCVHVTWREIVPSDLAAGVSPIGLPIADLKALVLDRHLRPQPRGVVGELFVGGAGLARGYWNRPALTATRFVPDPHGNEPGARLYRSGDGALFDWRDELVYRGRLDEQVKIRGFRIELAEVAAALRKHPELDRVAVLVKSMRSGDVRAGSPNLFHEVDVDTAGEPLTTLLRNLLKHRSGEQASTDDRRLVAYYTSARSVAASELRAFLSEHLPEHMIPSHFVGLMEFPLTSHGKLDARALPLPDHSRPVLDTAYVPPRNAQERKMADVWAEILQLDQVGIDDPFFDLGGDSILSIRLRARAQQEGLDFSLQELMRQRTIRGLLANSESAAEMTDGVTLLDPFALISASDRARLPEAVVDAYPPARLQEGLLFHSSFSQDIPMYCDIFIYQFRAPFRDEAFREALDGLCARHPILRTAFDFDGFSEPLQLVYREAVIPLFVEDLRGSAVAAQQDRLHQWLETEKRRNYDWKNPPLLRFNVFLLEGNEFYLGMSFHDALMDGWSESSILTELLTDYFALLEGRQVPGPSDGVAFRDFVGLERQILADEAQWRFWQEELADLQVAHLPIEGGSVHLAEPRMVFLDVAIASELSDGLKELATRAGTGLKHVLLAAHCRLLAFLTGQNKVLTALESNGRLEIAGGEAVLGCHLNAVPFRLALEDMSWLQLVVAVRDQETRVAPFRRFPYAEIQRRIGGEQLFDSSFNYTHFHVYRQLNALRDLEILGAHAYIQTHFALRVEFNQDPFSGAITLDLEADEHKLSAARLREIAGMFKKVLTSMVQAPSESIGEACLLSLEARHRLLLKWNDTHRPQEPELPQQAFARQVASRAAQEVASDAHGSITYAALGQVTDRIAAALRRRGIRHEGLVAILADRGIPYLSLVLGTFKAGGAYLPLAGSPVERAARVLSRAGASLLVCTREHCPQAQAILEHVPLPPALVALEDLMKESSEAVPPAWSDSRLRLANIFFTSGSTGEPKGAMIHYAGMANHLSSKIHMLDLGPEDLVSQDAAQTFDISLWQMVAAPMVGGRVCIFPDEIAKDPIRLFHAVDERGITILEVSPAVLAIFVEEAERLGEKRPSFEMLRFLPCSGEALPPDLCRRWLALYPAIPIFNMWGATECSDDVSQVKVACAPLASQAIMPLGFPSENIQILILDRFGQLVPCGTPGELYIGGAGVGRGYRGDPVRSALTFVPNPFAGSGPGMPAGSRLYRTGDLGRMRGDGQAEFLGRRDHQIKIRGFRVELGDIEAALTGAPDVSQALVVTATDPRGDKFLAAYLCPREPQSPESFDLAALRNLLSERLPAYMIPTTYTVLQEFPRNTNGKIDRKALPEPILLSECDTPIEAPRGASEEKLAAIWGELLGLDAVGRDQDFFLLGGHSLLATRVAGRIREHFGFDISIRTLFEQTTIAELAQFVDAHKGSTISMDDAIRPIEARAIYPLSFAQSRLWVLDQLEGDHGTYNMASHLSIRGELSLPALHHALARIVARHEILRTTFHREGDQVFQRVSSSAHLDPRVFDLTDLERERRDDVLNGLIRSAARMRFDLSRGPLVDLAIVALGPVEHVLLITMHHIISDGWSGGVMVRELATHYGSWLDGEIDPLPPLPIQYRDFAVWQLDWFQGSRREQQLKYWLDRLDGAPPLLDLPTDFPRPAVQSFRGSEFRFEVPAALLASTHRFAESENLSLFMVLHSTLALLLYHFSGERDLVIGSPVANRDRSEIEPLIGFFVNTLVLRTPLDPAASLRENLLAVRDADLEAFANQHLPFEQLVDAIQPERNLSHNPLFQVMLVLQNAPTEPMALPGLELSYALTRSETSKFDMLLSVEEREDKLFVSWEYATDLFTQSTIRGMANHFLFLLQQLPSHRALPLAHLPTVDAAQRHLLIERWNDRNQAPSHEFVHHFFQAAAQRFPDRIAIVAEDGSLTYAELENRARSVAAALISHGVGVDQLVGLAVDRSCAMAISILGVLMAGAAYVPLDPNYPEQRLSYMIDDAAMPLILTQARLADGLPNAVPKLLLEDLATDDVALPERALDPNQLVYGIYTSGSTGKPKCTLQSHRALANMLDFFARDVHPEHDRTFAYASLSFDVHLMDLFGGWAHGHTVYMVPEDLRRNPQQLLAFVHRHQINRVVVPVVVLHAWAEEYASRPTYFDSLRHIGSTGEALTLTEPVKRLFAALPHVRLSNYYGPTETHVITAHELEGPSAAWPYGAPIGMSLANTRSYLLDDQLQPVPLGARGFLLSGGRNAARGYHRRPALTAERFLPDPFADTPGARMYHTGDLVRYRDGEQDQAPPLDYLGRRDHMVKLRGFRIELGEISALLARWPDMRFAHVSLVQSEVGAQLVAYLQVAEPHPTREQLCAFLGEALPAHMIPDHFVFIDDLPLSPNGKVDLRRLPKPSLSDDLAPRPPHGAAERWLLERFKDLVKHDHIGVDHNFFELGGHSITATRLANRVEEGLALSLPPREIFRNPTVRTLADFLATQSGDRESLDRIAEMAQQIEAMSDEEVADRLETLNP